ncbi:IgGFc-binding protein [Aplochiton taeniatus]
MGTCTYVMSKNCNANGSLPAFEVQTQNENRGSLRVSYVGLVTVKVYDLTITAVRSEIGRVRINNGLWSLPVVLNDRKVLLSQSGRYVLVKTDFGLTVQYDWEHHVVVTLSSSYAGKACGLCGNFNGNPNDDFSTPAGAQAGTSLAFGSSWKVPGLVTDAKCVDECVGGCERCDSNLLTLWGGQVFCGLLTMVAGGPFAKCHASVDPSTYFENCKYDVCMGGGLKELLCRALEAYTEACQRANIQVLDWRAIAQCPAKCPANSRYELCGSACPATCSDPVAPTKCKFGCVETCTCHQGFVLSGGQCVPAAQCGCTYQGYHIPAGQSFWADQACHSRCLCTAAGRVECKDSGCRTGQACQVVDGIRDCYPVAYGTCQATGDPHYLTFDKKRFDFQGTCVYQMAALCSKNAELVPFEILVQNNNRGSKVVAFTKLVEVRVYSLSIIISQQNTGLIMVNGELVNLPISLSGGQLSVYKSGWTAVVTTAFGLKVTFDWSSAVFVTLPSTYMSFVCGLCGNYNGQAQDDLIPKNGANPVLPVDFGTSWRVEEIPGCVNGCKGTCPDCDITQKRQYEANEFCGLLRDPAGPFRECRAKVDPVSYFEDCVFDVCLYKGKKEVLCQAVTAYMSACQAIGANVYSWRTPQYCEVKCPTNSHYEVCGSGCPATCQSLSSTQTCRSQCKEGCSCDEGYILSGDTCVPIAQCGCLYGERYYQSGEVFYPNGKCEEECKCTKNGLVECKAFSCRPNEECEIANGVLKCNPVGKAVCHASGDPHYLSFDGRKFDFQGTCTYTLAKACGLEGTNLVAFAVQVENQPWVHNKIVSVTRLVALEVYGFTLILRNGMFGVLVNGVFNNLPMSLNNGGVKVYKQGLQYVMSTDFGLLLTYDLVYHVSVTVPGNYRGKTCGLCGNFNGDLKDDFRLPSQQVTDKIAAFGESWKVAIPGVVCDNGCEGNNCPACPPAQRAVFEKPTHCGIVREPTGPFATCHSKLDPIPYFNDCIFDVCIAKGDEKMLCDSVAAYALNCRMAGVDIKNWRTSSFCPLTCPANSHYEVCADDCSSACPELSAIAQCSKTCTEGCECDAGFFFDGQNCVKGEQCGCYGNGRTYMPGEVVYEGDCDRKCSCSSTKGLACEAYTCPKDTKCQVKNGVKACYNTDPCKDAKCRVKETCSVKTGEAVCVPQYTGNCWGWGDPHYHTFDGYNYDFQGTCKYTLSKTSGNLDGLVSFSVSEKNENRGNTAVSYAREVSVSVFDFTIDIVKEQIGKVLVNGELLNLPVRLGEGQVTVTQYGGSALVETNFGLRVFYDWNWFVLVQLPSTYYGLVTGLCGNFNGNVSDELQGPAGMAVSSVILWGNSWRVPGQEGACADTCPSCPVCDANQRKPYQTNELCGALTDKSAGLFVSCSAKVDPQAFFDSCVYDMCMNKGDRKMLCQALASYSERCRDQSVVVQKWRQKYGCPLSCQPNSHYEDCASPCQPSCPFPDQAAVCSLNCVESCVCDKGYVLSAGVCVPANTCGCSYQGRYYKAGQRFWTNQECNRLCECDTTLGIVTCREASCSANEKCGLENGEPACQPISYSSCTAAGDPHYSTFDGRRFDFQGTCEYLLVSLISQKSGLQPFSVTVQNDRRGNNAVSFTKAVTVTIYNVSITISRNYPFKVLLLGQLVSLPLNYNGQLTAYLSGRSVVLETEARITVTYDWQSVVRVTLPSSYQGSVGGLCGNYNGNPQDDLTMRDGKVAPDATSFGNSWLQALMLGCASGCQGAACQGCSDSQKQVYLGTSYCGLITDKAGPFKECLGRLDPAPFLENCVYDACQYQGHQGTVCNALVAYTSACQGLGVNIPAWRSLAFCPMACPANSHYSPCGPGCPSTCASFSAVTTCKRLCAEGCECDDGFLWSGSACVPVAECGCSYGGRYYKQGEVFYPDAKCQQQCSCGATGAVSCKQAMCGPGETCKVENGVQGCLPQGQAKCVASGDPHYITFDGTRFDFQGDCVYTLAKVVNDNDQLTSFTVNQANEKYGSGTVSVTKSVTVAVYGIVVRIERGMAWRVLVDGESMNLPLLLNGGSIQVNQQGQSIILQTDFGLRVLYDTAYYVEVIVPSTYQGKMRGLCGNYNTNAADDFMLPTGKLTTSVDDFGLAWVVDQPGSACGGCGGQCAACTPANTAVYMKPDSCGITVAAQGPFEACQSKVNPTPYLNHCVYDVCALGGDKETLCKSIQAYALACQDAGFQLKPWRTSSFCPITCPANSHYELCADTCANTCASLLDGRFSCSDRCYEGCQCDAGFVSDGVKCVHMDTCGCVYGDQYLTLGQTMLSKDCSSKCVCQSSGMVKCEKLACASKQICTVKDGVRGCYVNEGNCLVNGNALLTTFDGVAGPMGAVGAFEVASLCDRALAQWFRVVVDVRVCNKLPGTPSVATVYVFFNDVTVTVNSRHVTWVNGKTVLLPSTLANQLSVQIIDKVVVIERASSVRVTYSISQELNVTVGDDLANKVCGACGNFNNNAQDDLKTAEGGVAAALSAVVGSWRAGDFSTCGL